MSLNLQLKAESANTQKCMSRLDTTQYSNVWSAGDTDTEYRIGTSLIYTSIQVMPIKTNFATVIQKSL